MISLNGTGLIEDRKIKSLHKKSMNLDSSYLEKFVEEELKLGELGKRKTGDQPMATQDDKALTAGALRFLISIDKNEERDSGRPSLSHPVDTAKELINAYLHYFDHQRNWAPTPMNAGYYITGLFHDSIEDSGLTKQAFFQNFNQVIDSPGIEKKEKYRLMLPGIWKNIVLLTRHGNYEKLWRDIVNQWNKESLACKLSDRTVNVREMGNLQTPLERFFDNRIKEPIKRIPYIQYPSRELLNTLSSSFHRGAERIMDFFHDLEIKRRLYPNPKTLYEVFKSFIIIDATNAYMKEHLIDDFLMVLKQRLIGSKGASLDQLKVLSEHLLKYHCIGLKRGYALMSRKGESMSEVKKTILDNPLFIISDHYLKRLKRKSPIFSGDLTDPGTVEKALKYFDREYKKRKTGTRFNVGDLIYLDHIFDEYKKTGGIDRVTYARKEPREHPFDNLFYKWFIQIARKDKKVMEELIKEYEEEYKLIRILNYKFWQYYSNPYVLFDWGKSQTMRIDSNGNNGTGEKDRINSRNNNSIKKVYATGS